MKDIFIVIPAFNEQQLLASVIAGLHALQYSSIVVVDDGSEVPLREISLNNGCYYIRHKINLGQGAAIQTGILFALSHGAKLIVTFDSDGQHDPRDIAALIAPLIDNSADISLGSRFLGTAESMPFFRVALIQVARFFHLLFTGFWMTDAHNGLRAMNRNAAQQIKLTENRMAHATEFLLEIRQHHLKWKEVPVNIIYSDYSKGKGQGISDSVRILFDIFLHKLFR